MARKFRSSINGGITFTEDTQELPFALAGTDTIDDVRVQGIGETAVSTDSGAAARGQNIASRGKFHDGTIAANGAKTRMKGIGRFTIGEGGAISLQPIFSNFRLNNTLEREVDGPAYTIRKAAVSYEGVTVPLLFSGSRSVTLAAGAAFVEPTELLPSQFGVSEFLPGYVAFVRMSLDLPGTPIPAQIDPMYAGGESQLLYAPANDIDDIDLTTWAEPVGSDQWISFPHAVMLAGRVKNPMTSTFDWGDSIPNGAADNSGDGSSGGGWVRRATFAAQLPYISVTRTGDKAQFAVNSNTKTVALLKKAAVRAGFCSLGNNDIRDGRTTPQLMADLRAVWSLMRSCGALYVSQSLILSETTATDQGSSIAGQTVKAGFGAGSVREAVNNNIAALDGGNLTDYVDIVSPVQTANKWNVPTYTATLASAAVAWTGSVSLTVSPSVGDFLVFEPGTPVNQDATWLHVTGVSGSGPFTATLTGGPTKDHASGTTVKSSFSGDLTHPQQIPHITIAAKAASAMRRAKAIRKPWINVTKSFEIDFVNRRAQRNGVIVPVSSIASCVRASTGKATDNISWFNKAINTLRYEDGGGLFVEPARTNLVRNSLMIGGVAPSTKPDIWNFNLPVGVTASYQYGVENGINFVDARFTGSLAASGGISIDIDASIPTVVNDSWSHSLFLALLQNSASVPSGIELGGRVGNSVGSGVEFRFSPNLFPELTRKMARKSYSFTVAAATAFTLNPRLSVNYVGVVTIDITLRIGSPLFEKALTVTSPIDTSGTAATRAADAVTLALPAGTHNLTFTFDNGSTQVVNGVSGNYVIPTNLNRAIINSVSGVAA